MRIRLHSWSQGDHHESGFLKRGHTLPESCLEEDSLASEGNRHYDVIAVGPVIALLDSTRTVMTTIAFREQVRQERNTVCYLYHHRPR